jgi:hypothetical protein
MQIVPSTLDVLAKQINAENAALAGDLKNSLERAARIGALLLEAKSQLPHGKFREWMEANVTVGRTQASKYMVLAANVHHGGQIEGDSIRAAYVAVQAPKRETARKREKPRAPGPRTKVSRERLAALDASAGTSYTNAAMKAAIKAIKADPEGVDLALAEQLRALCDGVIEQATARLEQAA